MCLIRIHFLYSTCGENRIWLLFGRKVCFCCKSVSECVAFVAVMKFNAAELVYDLPCVIMTDWCSHSSSSFVGRYITKLHSVDLQAKHAKTM